MNKNINLTLFKGLKPLKFYLLTIMRIFLLLITIGLSSTYANSSYGQTKININVKDVTFENLFYELQHKSKFIFFYKDNIFNKNQKVTLQFKNTSLNVILDKAFLNTSLIYVINDRQVIVKKKKEYTSNNQAQQKFLVQGKVTDIRGIPLLGATIVEKGTRKGVTSDLEGNYSIKVSSRKAILKVTYIGYKTQEIVVGKNPIHNFMLAESSDTLEEIVISTGYQDLPKDRPTGSFSKITSAQLNTVSSNIIDKMEGLAPGLTIYNTGRGAIGENAEDNDFFIRGISTFSSVTPLIVVDGFPLEEGSSINSINSNDIETITILKDAAASSIYGLRSANGVIVITLKKGRGSKITVGYRSNYTFGSTPDLTYIKRLRAKDQVAFEEEWFNKLPSNLQVRDPFSPSKLGYSKVYGILYDKKEGLITPEEARRRLNKLASYDNTKDLEKAFLNKISEIEHNFSFSGTANSNKLNYYASFNYTDKAGIYKKDNEKINKFNLKLSYKLLDDKLKIDVNTSIVKHINSISPLRRQFRHKYGGESTLIPTHLKIDSYENIRDENGNPSSVMFQWSPEFLKTLATLGKDESWSPLSDLTDLNINKKKLNTRISINLQYHLTDAMYIELGGYTTVSYSSEEYFKSANSYYNRNIHNYYTKYIFNWDTFQREVKEKLLPGGDILTQTNNDRNTKFYRAQIVFNKYLKENKKHHLNFLLGAERKEYTRNSLVTNLFGYDKQSLIFGAINFLDLIELKENLHESIEGNLYEHDLDILGGKFKQEDRFVSFYSNFNYMYNERYIFSGSIRLDQSNHFGTDPKYRYTPIWSAGFRWKIDKEDFLADNEWINRLSLRTTYGFSGNTPSYKNASSRYILERYYNNEYDTFFNTPTVPKNSGLRQEKTSVLNVGLDFGILNEKYSGSIDVYRKNTVDVLSNKIIDPTKSGFYTAYLNDANIVNRGIDINFDAKIIDTQNFKWLSTINYSYNNNIVKKVYSEDIGATDVLGRTFNAEGYPVRSLFAMRWKGLNSNGESVVLDNEGNEYTNIHTIKKIPSMKFYKHMGSVIPKQTIGLINVFWYNNFELSIFFIYSGGNVMISDKGSYRLSGSNREFPISLNYWRKSGDENTTDTPNFSGGVAKSDNTYLRTYADINFEDASFLKLRRVMLSYDLAKALGKNSPFSYCKLRFQGNNLWSWFANKKGIDPEAYIKQLGKRTISIPASFSLGIDIKF